MFKAELFNVTEWTDLFVRSGARYIVPTSKHHGQCQLIRFNSPPPPRIEFKHIFEKIKV